MFKKSQGAKEKEGKLKEGEIIHLNSKARHNNTIIKEDQAVEARTEIAIDQIGRAIKETILEGHLQASRN